MEPHPPEFIDVAADLILRRPTPNDAEDMAAAIAASLEHLVPWMPWAAAPDAGAVTAQHERLEDVARAWDSGEEFHSLAATRDGGAILGRFGLHRRIGPGALELGYWLRPDAVGKGYASACARALTAVALSLPDVERVEIHCDEANVRSQRVPRAAGYRLDRIEADEVQAPAEVGGSMIWVFPPDAI
jgi:RimJ/RimL family protein N-acetyltransferase